jgi:hypothetical protein
MRRTSSRRLCGGLIQVERLGLAERLGFPLVVEIGRVDEPHAGGDL